MGDTYRLALGTRVKDRISGFTGIVISRTEFLHGCVRVGVQPQELKDGKPVECQAFDEPQLETLAPPQTFAEPAVVAQRVPLAASPHGDREMPSAARPQVPRR